VVEMDSAESLGLGSGAAAAAGFGARDNASAEPARAAIATPRARLVHAAAVIGGLLVVPWQVQG